MILLQLDGVSRAYCGTTHRHAFMIQPMAYNPTSTRGYSLLEWLRWAPTMQCGVSVRTVIQCAGPADSHRVVSPLKTRRDRWRTPQHFGDPSPILQCLVVDTALHCFRSL